MCIYKTDDGKCKKFSDDKTTSYCVNAPCEHEKLSNYDRIRNMSVDEMAKFIPDWSYTKACKCDDETYVDCNNECWKCVKEWLESEAE